MNRRREGHRPHSTALNANRRRVEFERLSADPHVDIVVIGGGVTGAGIALDAASRGLRTVLVERHDLAYGTSRWSSKLVHGGLRYLASGQFAIAHESASERHLLMTRIAPHLTRPLAQITPLYAPGHIVRGAYLGAGFGLGDGLRRIVGTPGSVLHRPGVISRRRTLHALPSVLPDQLHGAIQGWDGQLIDDARLVVALARTAAGFGASVLTRVGATAAIGNRVVLHDMVTGAELGVHAGAVINATGVWAGELDDTVTLRPSRGSHLVVDAARLGGMDLSLTVPVPGESSRFVFTVPAIHQRAYIGLTDVPLDGPPPDVPHATEAEIDMLLNTINTVLRNPLTRSDIRGTFAGLRPLLAGTQNQTADLSRRHAIVAAPSGLLSVLGGKLTTYRRMAEDAVNEAVRLSFAERRVPSSRTHALPLVGAWPREELPTIAAPARLVRRYGIEAPFVERLAAGESAARGVTAQELHWGVAVEGALSVADLVDRRTRLGLVDEDREQSVDAAAAAFERAGVQAL
ncbi:FAD-dependent oxidoreductase (plasmid) [Coraliomargarita sp. W4R53]